MAMWMMGHFFGLIAAAVFGAAIVVFMMRMRPAPFRIGWCGGHGATDERDRELGNLAATAERLQARIETLERLLDAMQPDWRNKA